MRQHAGAFVTYSAAPSESPLRGGEAQRATQIRFHVEQFPLQKFAARQQHSLLLSQLRLHMHWLEQACPHHLGNPTHIVPIAFVDLLRLQKRRHVPSLDADRGQPLQLDR